MPKPPSTVPFEKAVEMVGGEGVFYQVAPRRNTVATWRIRGVPWSVLGPIILARLQAIEGTTPKQRPRLLGQAMREPIRPLPRDLRTKKGKGRNKP